MPSDNLENKYLFFDKYASDITESERILATPSEFAKQHLFYLQEIGELKSLKIHESKRNTLDSFLIVLIVNGRGVFKQSGNDYNVKSGDLIFINCNYSYSHVSDENEPWTLKWVHFKGPKLEHYHQFFKQKYNSIYTSAFDDNSILKYHTLLSANSKKNKIEREFVISNLINNLITELLTNDKNKGIEKQKPKIDEVKTYIDDNYKNKISLNQLSDIFYISKFHMSREFRNEFGMTINNYITMRKITYCKELLRFSDLSIEDVGIKAGITDNSYFNKLFKKVEEMTPSDYRKIWTGK